MDWLEHHIESFIRPRLGFVPEVNLTNHSVVQFTPKKVRAIVAVWQEAKKLAKGRPMLLAGRDVWLFEVLARLEGFPTIFRPDISAVSAGYVTENYKDCYLLDTGNRGSVPKAMGIKAFGLIHCSLVVNKAEHMVFPRSPAYKGTVYGLYSLLEGVPKYWTRGYPGTRGEKIKQTLTENDESFKTAAMVTIHVGRLARPYLKIYIPQRVIVQTVGRGV